MTQHVFESITKIFAIISKSDGTSEEELQVFYRFLESNFDEIKVAFFKNYHQSFLQTIEGTREELETVTGNAATELTLEDRFLIFVRLSELVRADGEMSKSESEHLKAIARIFHLSEAFTNIISTFVFEDSNKLIARSGTGLISSGRISLFGKEQESSFHSDVKIVFTFLKDFGFFIMKVLESKDALSLNNDAIQQGTIFFLRPGSVLMANEGEDQLHFSSLWSATHQLESESRNLLSCENLVYHHPNGKKGIHEFSFRAESGDLIAVMGPSGSGKSTVMNVINGNFRPESGKVTFNGIDVHKESSRIKPFFGYVPQDDLLIEDLSVFDNLFFSARLSLPELSRNEVSERVDSLLKDLGLFQVRNLRVGNSLSKTISGGQRKRLNIALELIRNPAVLFMDEPTSGLSSRDSDNVMALLRELCFRGTIVFTVIHQPSSDIYKLFDQLILMDAGGFAVYCGNPVEAVGYFKRSINHVRSHITACPVCGDINPEIVFNILENKVIDEYGMPRSNRKTSPDEWYARFRGTQAETPPPQHGYPQLKEGKKPGLLLQWTVFFRRDLMSKLSNRQYLSITLLEPVVLALILAFIVRFYPVSEDNPGQYFFGENVNVPSFIFIGIIVSLFMGMSLSAEEIFRDLKILKREEFLMLSRFGYLSSKVSIQFIISFFQTILFVLPSCWIAGNLEMGWAYFLVLFSCACFANMLALNISSALSQINTIYILIPILLIPQLILGGIIVNYDKMNPLVAKHGKVPFVGDLMASRWAFEAACIAQFRDNSYNRHFFKTDQSLSNASYKSVYWLPEMRNLTDQTEAFVQSKSGGKSYQWVCSKEPFKIIQNEIERELQQNGYVKFDLSLLDPRKFGPASIDAIREYLDRLDRHYIKLRSYYDSQKEKITQELLGVHGKEGLIQFRKTHHNSSLEELLKSEGSWEDKIIHSESRLVRQSDPVFHTETIPFGLLDYRAHFFSPVKQFLGFHFDTLYFDVIVIWVMVFFLFLTLYFNILKKIAGFQTGKKKQS
jgi:ABC-type multidrug transport system ATPase subunit